MNCINVQWSLCVNSTLINKNQVAVQLSLVYPYPDVIPTVWDNCLYIRWWSVQMKNLLCKNQNIFTMHNDFYWVVGIAYIFLGNPNFISAMTITFLQYNLKNYVFIIGSANFILFSLALLPSTGYCLLISRGFFITHNDMPRLVGLFWMSDQPIAETSTWKHTTNIHAPSGIQTHNHSRRAAEDLRLKTALPLGPAGSAN
jgi:hypothetical protein